jgi:hypothetical protein
MTGEGRLLVLGLTWGEAWMVPATCAGLGALAQASSASAMPATMASLGANLFKVTFSQVRERG